MSNEFKNSVAAAVGTVNTTVYTTAASTTTTLIGLSLANIIASAITVSVTVTDTTAATTVYLVKDAPVPVGSALIVIGGDQKVVLETTDVLKVQSSDAASVDVLLSALEQT